MYCCCIISSLFLHSFCIIVLIAADLLVRLIPMKFNLAFGWPMAIIGFLVRAGFIALLIMDIRAAGNDKQEVKK